MKCQWCFAVLSTDPGDEAAHATWHRANGLHAAWCAWATRERAQRTTGVYLSPADCDCGLGFREEP